MYNKMSGLEIYIHAFDASVNAIAAMLPMEMSDNFGSYDVEFHTSLPASALTDAFSFTRSLDDLSLSSAPASWPAAGGVFSILNSVYHSQPAFISLKTGTSADSVPVLTDDYLGYIADKELGSQLLVGAFDNVPEIVASLGTDLSYTNIYDAALTGHSFDIPQFTTNNVTGDDSALWVVYSSVFLNAPDRLEAPADGVASPLLQAGDTIVVKLTVSTPDLDQSVNNYHPTGYSPIKPSDRTYKIKIALV